MVARGWKWKEGINYSGSQGNLWGDKNNQYINPYSGDTGICIYQNT